jgi:LVIVD repeat
MHRSAWFRALVAVGALLLALPATAAARSNEKPSGSIQQVGNEPLMNRGMNAALAVHGDYAYIGSRTDGSHAGQPQGGIMVVDISRPRHPELLTETPIDAKAGESSRELRVWRSQDILIVLNTNCGPGPTLHHCSTTVEENRNFRFYDISGRNARHPRLITEMEQHTHEFFLWQDPNDPDRALMFGGNAGSTCGEHPTVSCPFAVWDISPVAEGGDPVTLYSDLHGYTRIPPEGDPLIKPAGGLHSLSVSNDGTRTFYALLTGGFAVVDTSDFANGTPNPQPRPITFNEARPSWRGPGAHSAIKLWNRDWVWVSDEVYGTQTGEAHGCPWGWARLVDITDPTKPTVEAAYRIDENDPDTCAEWNPPRTSYSAHNPTLTPRIAFSTWHSGGLQAVGIEKPWRPYQLAEFFPRPLRSVLLEDPRLSSDPDTGRHEKVVMWSYPIIRDGLIYVTDIRNGFYVLRYKGAFSREVARIDFLEGNSNQGDALCFEPVGEAPAHCED